MREGHNHIIFENIIVSTLLYLYCGFVASPLGLSGSIKYSHRVTLEAWNTSDVEEEVSERLLDCIFWL